MNIAATLALQSIPFAGLALATMKGQRDLFTIVYVSALGLILSATAIAEGRYAVPMSPGIESGTRR